MTKTMPINMPILGMPKNSKIMSTKYLEIWLLQSMTSNCHTFLGTFTQKILFLDYNKTTKAKSVTIWGHGL